MSARQSLAIGLRAVLCLTFLLVAAFLFFHEVTARFVWQNYQWARAALWLNQSQVPLAQEIGNYYFGGGDYNIPLARRAFTQAAALDPAAPWNNYQLARICLVGDQWLCALRHINRELEINPKNLRALYVRGLIYGYRKNYVRAAQDFSDFIAWAPTEWAGYNDLAWVEGKLGNYATMQSAAERGIATGDAGATNPWLWNSRGVAALNLKDHETARASFERARELAEGLNELDWRIAYPGNDPASAAVGLNEFRKAIEKNLAAANAPVDNGQRDNPAP